MNTVVSYTSHILDVSSSNLGNETECPDRGISVVVPSSPKTMWVMRKTVFTQTPPGLSSPISRLFERRQRDAAAAQRVTVNTAPLNLVYILRCLVSFQDERSGTIIRPGM